MITAQELFKELAEMSKKERERLNVVVNCTVEYDGNVDPESTDLEIEKVGKRGGCFEIVPFSFESTLTIINDEL